MSAASKAFLADPKAFMKSNIVIVEIDTIIDSGEFDFDLTSAGDGLSCAGNALPVYQLSRVRAATTDPIQAFWLPYVAGTISSAIVDTKRSIFFTAGLSGCGFVAGGTGAMPVVKHYDGDIFKNDEIIDDPANAGMDIYTAANYSSDPGPKGKGIARSTVFGVKGKTQVWEFWAQARYVTPKFKNQLRFPEGIMPV